MSLVDNIATNILLSSLLFEHHHPAAAALLFPDHEVHGLPHRTSTAAPL